MAGSLSLSLYSGSDGPPSLVYCPPYCPSHRVSPNINPPWHLLLRRPRLTHIPDPRLVFPGIAFPNKRPAFKSSCQCLGEGRPKTEGTTEEPHTSLSWSRTRHTATLSQRGWAMRFLPWRTVQATVDVRERAGSVATPPYSAFKARSKPMKVKVPEQRG